MRGQLNEGWAIGETRVRWLLRQLDHSASVGQLRAATTDSDHDEPRFPKYPAHLIDFSPTLC